MQKSVEVKGFPIRLLYTNPVCILTTERRHGTEEFERNAMVISWLTPVNTSKLFMISLNRKRYSAEVLLSNDTPGPRRFVLNVPVDGWQETLLNIGGCSGREVDKFMNFSLPVVLPGLWTDDSPDITVVQGRKRSKKKDERWGTALDFCVAHLMCQVMSEQQTEVKGHHIFICEIVRAFVRNDYWDGKRFAPINLSIPPTLSFLGSKTFAATIPLKAVREPCENESVEKKTLGPISN